VSTLEDEGLIEREGYMLFVEPIIGLTRLFMTSITAWVALEIISTEHGRAMVQNLPTVIKAALHTYI
jgi:hypothetical protein